MIVTDNDYLIGLYQSEGGGRLKGLSRPSEIPTRHQLARSWEYMRVLNFTDVSHSMRFNPIQLKYIPTLQDAIAFSDRFVDLFWLDRDGRENFFQLYKESAKNFLTACIWFFLNYKKMPYKDKNTMLWPEYSEDSLTGHKMLTGRVFDTEANRDLAEQARAAGVSYSVGLVDPDSYYWLGKYSDLPHIIGFLHHSYSDMLEVLKMDAECFPLISSYMYIYDAHDDYLFEMSLLPIKSILSKLCTKEVYWLLHKDGESFDLSGRWNRDYLMMVCKENHQQLFKILNLLLFQSLPDGKEWTYTDKEFKWERFKTIDEGLKITPYVFSSADSKERILYACYNQVNQDVEDLIKEIYIPISPRQRKR